MSDPTSHPEIQIFRAGTHTDMGGRTLAFSAADIGATAAAYDPTRHHAPVVIGHPATDDPAFGWVRGLRADGDVLYAAAEKIDPTLREAVRAGRYGKVSAAFWTPASPGNPTPGVYGLRHVGLLGATIPAVRGLASVAFQDGGLPDADTIVFISNERVTMSEGKTVTPSCAATPPDPSALFADIADREARLLAREAAHKAEVAAFADRQRAARHAANDASAKQLAQAGVLIGLGEVAGMTAFLDGIRDDVVSFSDGAGGQNSQGARDYLLGLLAKMRSRLPPKGEMAAEKTSTDGINFADPAAIAKAAAGYEAEQARNGTPVTSTEAVLFVTRPGRS